jgi:adenylate cyclase
MDRIWQWAWDRYGARYSWAIGAIGFPVLLPIYLLASFFVVAFEESSHYIEAAAVTVVALLVLQYAIVLPGLGPTRLVERWAAGHEVDRARALEATYAWARGRIARTVGGNAVCVAVLGVVVGVIAGATGSRLIQYAILGGVAGTAVQLIAVHSFVEAAWRPARLAIAGDTASVTHCPALVRLLPRGPTCPYSPLRSRSPPRARCSQRWSIGPVRSRCCPW